MVSKVLGIWFRVWGYMVHGFEITGYLVLGVHGTWFRRYRVRSFSLPFTK